MLYLLLLLTTLQLTCNSVVTTDPTCKEAADFPASPQATTPEAADFSASLWKTVTSYGKAIRTNPHVIFVTTFATILFTVIKTLSSLNVFRLVSNYNHKRLQQEAMNRKLKNQRLPLLTSVWDLKFRIWGMLSPKDKQYYDRLSSEPDPPAFAYHITHTSYLFGQLFYELEKLRTDPFFSIHLDLALPLQRATMKVNRAFSIDKFALWPFPEGGQVEFSHEIPLTALETIQSTLTSYFCCGCNKTRPTLIRMSGWVRCKDCKSTECNCVRTTTAHSGAVSHHETAYYTTLPLGKGSNTPVTLHERIQFTVELDMTSKMKCDAHGIAYSSGDVATTGDTSTTGRGKRSFCTMPVLDHVHRNGRVIEDHHRMTACNDLFNDPLFCVFKGDQRALGQQMIKMTESPEIKACLTYNEFLVKLETDENFGKWFALIRAQLCWILDQKKCGSFMPRLMQLHNYLVDFVDIIDEKGKIAMNVWGNSRQIYFDSRGLRIVQQNGEETAEQKNTSTLMRSASSASFNCVGNDGSLLRCVSKDDSTRLILQDGEITHLLRNSFPKPAVSVHETLFHAYKKCTHGMGDGEYM